MGKTLLCLSLLEARKREAMAQFWKPGTEKPRLLDDEEGGVLFYSSSPSSSGYFIFAPPLSFFLSCFFYFRPTMYSFHTTSVLFLVLDMQTWKGRGRSFQSSNTGLPFSIWSKITPPPLSLVRPAVGKPLRFHRYWAPINQSFTFVMGNETGAYLLFFYTSPNIEEVCEKARLQH